METKHALSAEDRYRAAAGAVFKRLREKQQWSLRDFGEQVGAAHTTLYAVERGETTPGIDVLDRVAAAIGLDLVALLAMILDQLRTDEGSPGDSLPSLMYEFAELTQPQRAEALNFIRYLRYRDDQARTD